MPEAAPPTRRFLLVSTPLPSGIGYVGDILLRLGIKVKHDVNDDDVWVADGAKHRLTEDGRTRLGRSFASVGEQETFEFRDAIEVEYEHRYTMINQPHDGVIIVTRDPVDAAFSNFTRYKIDERGLNFLDHLKMPMQFPQHFGPESLVMTPLAHYALFNIFWWLAAESRFHLRFEDAKTKPMETITSLLDFLGVYRSADAIAEAVDASSIEKARNTRRADASWFQDNRRGMVYEWRERMSEQAWRELTDVEPVRTAVALLGYGHEATPLSQLIDLNSIHLTRIFNEPIASNPSMRTTTQAFVMWAEKIRAQVTKTTRPYPVSSEIWWPPTVLHETQSLEIALRFLERTLDPRREGNLPWYWRLWIGIAAILERSRSNPQLQCTFANVKLPL